MPDDRREGIGVFGQYVSPYGYEIVAPDGDESRRIVRWKGYSKEGLTYDPYETPDLITEYANVKTEKGVIEFCNKYGLPFNGITGINSFAQITLDSMMLSAVLKVWSALRQDGEKAILKAIEESYRVWEDSRIAVEVDSGVSDMRLHIRSIPTPELFNYSKEYKIEFSNEMIAFMIQDRTYKAGGYSLVVKPFKRTPASKAVMRLHLKPDSLAGAIWHMLAEKVGTDSTYGQCQQCGRWFSASGRNGHLKKWCSDACKVRNSRAAKKAT